MTSSALGNPANRHDVLVLFGESNRQLHLGLRQALRAEGFLKIREVDSEIDLRQAVRVESPDIAIIDVGLGGDIVAAVRDLRQGKLGANPYAVIILTSWNAESDAIRRMMNSGADEILVKPLSVATLVERIASLINRRKPYLATADYVGPDRRGGRQDPNAVGVELIHPPNTLRAKIEGHPLSRDELAVLIQETQIGMADQRLQRDVTRVVNLSRSVQDAWRDGRRDPKLASELDQLASLGAMLREQVSGTPYAQVGAVFNSLHKTAANLRDNLPDLNEKEVKLLVPLADSLAAAMGSPAARRQIAEIVTMVGSFQKDRRPPPDPAAPVAGGDKSGG